MAIVKYNLPVRSAICTLTGAAMLKRCRPPGAVQDRNETFERVRSL
jgi:hypothetical protein